MKHFSLLIILLVFSNNIFSQQNPCIPNATLQDSTFGLWPDTTNNLPVAIAEQYYEEHIQIKTPATVGEVMGDPFTIDVAGFPVNIAPITIDSIKLVAIEGLPSVMSTYLSNSDSVYEGNSIGCVTLYGTPGNQELGQHNISLLIDGWVSILGLGVTSLYEQLGDYETIDGYKLIVQKTASINDNERHLFSLSQNIPNPFSSHSIVEVYSNELTSVQFSIVDILGKLVYQEAYQLTTGMNTIEIDGSALKPGFYYYSITDGKSMISKKMIVQSK
ncbi:MAG: T9SS type A sorting domain-containing protein [Flavobacteriales bacterium]